MSELKSGYVAIVGRPNVGKSTLLNRLIGQKVSIVSRKAQTTRHRIMGILTNPDAQYVFVDTPGFQTKHTNALNRAMNRGVTQALADVDVVLFVVEAGRFDDKDKAVIRLLPADRPVIIVVNKIDQLKDKTKLLPFMAELAKERDFAAIIPVSAAKVNNSTTCCVRRASTCRIANFCSEKTKSPTRARNFSPLNTSAKNCFA